MKTTIDSVKQGLAGFLDGEFIPKYKKTHSAAASYGVAVIAALAIDNLGNTAEVLIEHPLAAYLGVIDKERNIDVTKVCEFMRAKMPREGLKVPVPMIGILSFDRSDVDALEQYMEMQAPKNNLESSVEECL